MLISKCEIAEATPSLLCLDLRLGWSVPEVLNSCEPASASCLKSMEGLAEWRAKTNGRWLERLFGYCLEGIAHGPGQASGQ